MPKFKAAGVVNRQIGGQWPRTTHLILGFSAVSLAISHPFGKLDIGTRPRNRCLHIYTPFHSLPLYASPTEECPISFSHGLLQSIVLQARLILHSKGRPRFHPHFHHQLPPPLFRSYVYSVVICGSKEKGKLQECNRSNNDRAHNDDEGMKA